MGPVVALCAPFYPAELGDKVLRAWRDFMAQAPEEVGSALLYWAVPENPFFSAETQGRPVVIPVGIYNGEDVEEGQRLMRPLRELGTRLLDLSDPIPWTAVQSMFDPFLPNGDQYYWKSLYLDDLGEGAATHIVQLGNSRPSPNTAVILLPFGGAFARVAADATAFGRRDMSYLLELNSCWKDLRDNEVNIAWTRQAWSDSQRFSKGGLYLNSPGLGEEGERLVRSAVGPGNYQRLVALKNKYDPTNLFRLNQNIKPTV